MFAVTVTFHLAPAQSSAFLPLVTENAALSLRDEPGCRRFDVCTDPDRPDEVFLYELYDDRAAFDAHLATSHFRAFEARTADMIADRRLATYAEVAA